MIDIEELKRKALACQAFHAAGSPVDDPHDTYPPDHYDAAVQPKYILALIDRLEAAERDAARFRWVMQHAEVIFDKPVRFQQTLCYQAFTRIPDRPYLCTAIDAAIAKGKS